jgi:hypothetical protein
MKLHPGLRIALDRFDFNETDIAKALADGELSSPQRYKNSWYFRLRISGTGYAYRPQLSEYVFRPVEVYVSPDMLDRCNGLPVIMLHPEKMTLDTEDLHRRIIGTIVLPYIGNADGRDGDSKEVWGVARIMDMHAAELMRKRQLSTSPGIELAPDQMDKVKLDDGRHLLNEGEPELLDHVAICVEGVWDKLDGPSGVDVADLRAGHAGENGEKSMAEEAKEMEREEEKDGKKADSKRDDMKRDDNAEHKGAGEHAEPDEELKDMFRQLNDSISAMHKRMDAMEMRHDKKRDDEASAEKEESQAEELEELAEEEREEAKDKKDGERDDKKGKKADSKRDDKRTDAKRDDKRADMKRDDKRADMKRDDEDEAEHKAEEIEKEEGAPDEEKKVDSRRMDSLERDNDTLRRELRALQRKVADRPAAEEQRLAASQARADSVYGKFGDRAPAPMMGETETAYDVRLARGLQKHSKAWKDEDLTLLARTSATAFENAVAGIYNDALSASATIVSHDGGVLMPFTETSPTGHRVTTYRGDNSVWMQPFSVDYGVGRLRQPQSRALV